jgi:hypothetical protein
MPAGDREEERESQRERALNWPDAGEVVISDVGEVLARTLGVGASASPNG